MPPKEAAKKVSPPPIRPLISAASLFYVPEDAVEGYQERIETGIEWTLFEQGSRHHKKACLREEILPVSFSEALQKKIDNSIIGSFLKEDSGLTLEQLYEFLLPVTLWDNEKFASKEEQICFMNANCITDDVVKVLKRAVKFNNRDMLTEDIKLVNLLRVNNCKMTKLDKTLMKFKKLVSLNLCGNFIKHLNAKLVPRTVRIIELQSNAIGDVREFATDLPDGLLYIGLARNLLNNDSCEGLKLLPRNLTTLDLSDNDIYDLEPLLDCLVRLTNLTGLSLAGNPCSVCAAYGRTTISRLPHLKWLDSREIISTDRSVDSYEPHPDDLRSAYFYFSVFRIVSVLEPPKLEKGSISTFHVELEIPLLDSRRRNFLMFRRHESLIEYPPQPEDFSSERSQSTTPTTVTNYINSKFDMDEQSAHESDIYKNLTSKDSRIIYNFTTFESNKVQWSKMMNFQEPTVRIFCPDLVGLRDTFRTAITIRLVYTLSTTPVAAKPSGKKSAQQLKSTSDEQRAVIATIKCMLKKPDWSQPSQHFHWDDSLGTDEAIHWGDGDLSVLNYSLGSPKPAKGKEPKGKEPRGKEETSPKKIQQLPPDNLTCHFGFGIETVRF